MICAPGSGQLQFSACGTTTVHLDSEPASLLALPAEFTPRSHTLTFASPSSISTSLRSAQLELCSWGQCRSVCYDRDDSITFRNKRPAPSQLTKSRAPPAYVRSG